MSHPRLLLADEDQTARAFLADNLTADGYHVDTVEDPQPSRPAAADDRGRPDRRRLSAAPTT